MPTGCKEWVGAAGKSERAIMAQTGHKGTDIVRRYLRLGELFRNNVDVGLR